MISYKSHLLQMRGLKPPISENVVECEMSHLLQMRGLKQGLGSLPIQEIPVASFTDAWIETILGNLE